MREYADPRRTNLGYIVPVNHCNNARRFDRLVFINFVYPRVCIGRAKKSDMYHTRQFCVVSIVPPAIQQAFCIRTGYGPPDVAIRSEQVIVIRGISHLAHLRARSLFALPSLRHQQWLRNQYSGSSYRSDTRVFLGGTVLNFGPVVLPTS